MGRADSRCEDQGGLTPVAHHLAVLVVVAVDHGPELLDRGAHGPQPPGLVEPGPQLWRRKRDFHSGAQALQHPIRRSGRREQPDPDRDFVARKRVGDRRQLRKVLRARRAGHGQCAQLPGRDHRRGRTPGEHDRGFAGNRRGHRWQAATVVPTYRTIFGAFAPLLAFLVGVCYQERSHRFVLRGPVARVAYGRTGLRRGFNVR